MIYISILLESLAAMVIVGAACKFTEGVKNGLSTISKGRISPITSPLSLKGALTSGIGVLLLNNHIDKPNHQ
ncbi:MAG: hypothetical protein KFB93_02675 [Simkaniaceae bacterium]|jgi:hypothetical protein|nr:MAG: hypothetical protein KFB93_02675 [Simkaniaceae bacterium]